MSSDLSSASDYTIRPLGDFFDIVKERSDAPLPIYSVTLRDGMQRRDELGRIIQSDLKSEDNLFAAKNDICYNMMRMWQGASGLAPEDCHVSPAYVVCRPKEGLDPRFAAYLLKSEQALKQFIDRSQGVTSDRWRLYPEEFIKIRLPIPPLPEQKKIAEILSGIDMAIKTMHSAIIKIDNAIQGARDQTQACEGDHVRIGELIAKISTGVSVNGENRPCKASEHGILKVSCVSKGVFYPSENKVIQGEHKDRATMSVKKGMLLMSRANTPELVGACGFVTNDHDNLFLPDKIWNLEISQYAPCSKRWLNNALNSCIARSRLRDASTGTSNSMRNISQNNFCEIELLIPTPETQQAQADAIDSLQKKRMAFAGKLSKYLMIKSALSDDLLSGRKRVPV